MPWRGKEFLAKVHKLQVDNLRRAAIHLRKAIVQLISRAGTESGIRESDVDRTRVVRTGRQGAQRTMTVTPEEYERVAGPAQRKRRAGVRRRLRGKA